MSITITDPTNVDADPSGGIVTFNLRLEGRLTCCTGASFDDKAGHTDFDVTILQNCNIKNPFDLNETILTFGTSGASAFYEV